MYGELMFNSENIQQSNVLQDFPREKKALQYHLGDLEQALADFNGILAGGAITSVFTGKEINDFDLYFPDARRASQFVAALYSGEFGYNQFLNVTNKSIMFTHRNQDTKCQIIYYKWHATVEDIFNDFDFTVNMGAYDPKEGKFILHADFLRHNAQRTLQVNTNTAYPLISVLRTHKYKERGYNISKPQLVRLLLAVSQLKITSWKELKDQLGGMYGHNVEKIFPEDQEFSLDKAVSVLSALEPKILVASDFENLYLTDIQEKLKDVFPEEFQKVEDRNKYYWNDKERDNHVICLDYAYPESKGDTGFVEVNETTKNDPDQLPF